MESEFAEKAATAAAAAATNDEKIQIKKYATMTKVRQSQGNQGGGTANDAGKHQQASQGSQADFEASEANYDDDEDDQYSSIEDKDLRQSMSKRFDNRNQSIQSKQISTANVRDNVISSQERTIMNIKEK